MATPTPQPAASPAALVKRIQHALLDLPVLDLGPTIGRLALASRPGQELPATPGRDEALAAGQAGVFREWPSVEGSSPSRWMLWCHLDELPQSLEPRLRDLATAEFDSISVGLAFQAGMYKARQPRRSSRPR